MAELTAPPTMDALAATTALAAIAALATLTALATLAAMATLANYEYPSGACAVYD